MGNRDISEPPKNLAKNDISFSAFAQFRVLEPDFIEELQFKRREFFDEAWAVNRLKPVPEVEELIKWGVATDEPMGIYLGEKIAMLTNQTISHKVARAVSSYLSHVRDIPQERIDRCKEALKVVGKINREHIYDFTRDYEHITQRKHFNKYLQNREK